MSKQNGLTEEESENLYPDRPSSEQSDRQLYNLTLLLCHMKAAENQIDVALAALDDGIDKARLGTIGLALLNAKALLSTDDPPTREDIDGTILNGKAHP